MDRPAESAGAEWAQWTDYLSFVDNGKRIHDQAQEKIQELVVNIRKAKAESKIVADKLEIVSTKLINKTVELTCAEVKVKVQKEMQLKLQKEIEERTSLLNQMRKELQKESSTMLRSNVNFMKIWNCTQLGRDFRANMKPSRVKQITAQKISLENELRDYLVAEKAYEAAVANKLEIENNSKNEDLMLSAKAEDLSAQIQRVDKIATVLTKQLAERKESRARENAEKSLKRKMIDNVPTQIQQSSYSATNNSNLGSFGGMYSQSIMRNTPKKQQQQKSFQFKKRNTQSTQFTQH